MPGILLITLHALGLFSLPTQVWGRYFLLCLGQGPERLKSSSNHEEREFGCQPWQCIKSLALLKLTLIYTFIVCICTCICGHMPVYLCA